MAGPGTMRIAIVIVTFNSASDLAELLPTVSGAVGATVDPVVVVADNGSSDASVDVASASALVDHLVRLENRGYAAAVNAGVRVAGRVDAVLVLNADLRLRTSAVAVLSSRLARDPSIGIVAPRLVDWDGRLLPSLRREPTIGRAWGEAILGGSRAARFPALGEVVADRERYEQAHDIEWATGAALLISARCWDAVGSWEESFFLYSEETDYCLRARDRGFRVVYEPGAVVEHREGEMRSSLHASIRAISAIRAYRMRHSVAPTVAFGAGMIVNSVLRIRRPEHRAVLLALASRSRRPSQVRDLSLLRAASRPSDPTD